MKRLYAFNRFLSIIVTCMLFSACQKQNNSENKQVVETALVEKVKNWLASESLKSKGDAQSKINSLRNNLKLNTLRTEDLYDGEKLVVISVNQKYISSNNIGKSPVNYLLLILDKNDKIRKGNIVQYISVKKGQELPNNFFSDYYNFKPLNITGSITFLGISDNFIYESQYEKGDKTSTKMLMKKPKKENGSTSSVQACWDVWLILLQPDGTYTILQYLYSFCYETGGGGGGEQPCFGSFTSGGSTYNAGCGGDAPDGPDGPDINKLIHWDIYTENMATSTVKIIGKVQFYGKKNSSEPQGGHFTAMYNQGSYTQNFSSYGMNWTGVYEQAWHSDQNAYHTTQGNIEYAQYGPPTLYIYRSKNFLFAEIFP